VWLTLREGLPPLLPAFAGTSLPPHLPTQGGAAGLSRRGRATAGKSRQQAEEGKGAGFNMVIPKYPQLHHLSM